MTETTRPPGWFPDPEDPTQTNKRYWNGTAWTANVSTPLPPRSGPSPTAVGIGVAVVLVLVGLIMNLQSVSVISGTSTVWFGVVLVAIGLAVAIFLVKKTVAIVACGVVLVLVVANAAYDEHQVDQRRDQIRNELNQLGK